MGHPLRAPQENSHPQKGKKKLGDTTTAVGQTCWKGTMYATEVHTSDVRQGHGFDVEPLAEFMSVEIPSFRPPLQVRPPPSQGEITNERMRA